MVAARSMALAIGERTRLAFCRDNPARLPYQKSRCHSSKGKPTCKFHYAQAQYGELKATQTSGQMARNVAISLGQIDAVRAAARSDSTFPSSVAVRDFIEQVGTEQKDIRVDSIEQQAQMDEANAAYLRTSLHNALMSGDVSMIGDALGLSGVIGRMAGKASPS
jgi:hypothetical protein